MMKDARDNDLQRKETADLQHKESTDLLDIEASLEPTT